MKKSTKAILIIAGIATVTTAAVVVAAKVAKGAKESFSGLLDDIDFTGCDSCLDCDRDEDEEEPKKEYDFSIATKSTYQPITHYYTTKDEVAEMINEAMEKAKEEKVD